MNVPYPHASPFGVSSPFDGPSLLDRYQGKPVGDIRFPKAATPQRPAVDPDYLAKTRENDPWPEGSSCAPPSDKPPATTPSVVLSNCRFLTPTDKLRFNEPFEMAVDVRRTAPGKTRRAFFDLHQSWIRDGVPEEQSIVRGIEGFPDSDGDTHTIKAKEVLETAMPYVLGETVEFWLTATHLEAPEPTTSPKVQVVLHHHAHWLGGDGIQFGLDSTFPRLGPDGHLVSILATALKRTANPPHPENPETTICFGHASASGNANHNRKLSLRRAQAVKAILDRDEKAWETLSMETFRTVDLQQFLADLAQSEGIGCDPGTVDGVDGPDTKSAVTAFQIHANTTWNLGLEVDGDCGRRTWKAILRQILALVQQELGKDPSKAPDWKTPLWGHEGKGVYGNGEDFASAEENPDERSVQITFFAGGSEPILKDVPENTRVTPQENPVEDAGQVRKMPAQDPLSPRPVRKRIRGGKEFDIPKSLEYNLIGSEHKLIWKVIEKQDADWTGLWGAVNFNEGVETPPRKPIFTFTKTKNGIQATLAKDHTTVVEFSMTRYLSSKWENDWGPGMDGRVGCENLPVEERKDRCFAHELDHYRCYMAYWRSFIKHTQRFANQTFENMEIANLEDSLLNARMENEFWRAHIRSLAFDIIHQRGEMYFQTSFCKPYRADFDLHEICGKPPSSRSGRNESEYKKWITEAISILKNETTILGNTGIHESLTNALPINFGEIGKREEMCIKIFENVPYEWIIK